MRLIDCYIENFGGLSSYSLIFDKEMTVIMEGNGFGKSTLAAFIKAMFYGFPKGARSLDKNERKLYTPWQGGKFGGNLSFEHEGISYRIERSFGATPKQDSFCLYELDPFRQSDRFSENIGQELFKLDVESYEKSTYMAQNTGAGTFATAGIQTKLGDLVDEADDIYNFEKAVERLREKRSSIKAFRGQTGRLYEIKSEISSLQAKIAEKSSVLRELEENKEKYNALNVQGKENENALKKVRERITKVSENIVLESLSKRLEELKTERSTLINEIDKLRASYVYALPQKEEVEIVSGAMADINKTEAILNALRISDDDRQTVENYKQFFEAGVPTEKDIAHLNKKAEELRDGHKKLAQMEVEKEALVKAKAKKQKTVIIALAAVLFVGAFVLLALSLFMPALIMGVLAIAAVIAAVIVKPKLNLEPEDEQIQLSNSLKALNDSIFEALKKYYGEKPITPEEYTKYLFDLGSKSRIYENALNNLNVYEQKKAVYEQQRESFREIVENFAKRNGFSAKAFNDDFFKKLRADIDRGNHLKLDLEKVSEHLETFEKENGERLKDFIKGEHEDIEDLKRKEQESLLLDRNIKTALISLEQNQAHLNRELEKFPLYEDELEERTIEFNECIKSCEILDKSIEYLTRAKDVLNYNYVKPIKDRFDFYVNQVLRNQDLKIFMDKELNVKPEQYGEAKELTYFSAGYTDMVRICMHFALVDVLFEEADGFIILDDPLVNLDDEKTKAALTLMKELSKHRQILYLTCNSSRV